MSPFLNVDVTPVQHLPAVHAGDKGGAARQRDDLSTSHSGACHGLALVPSVAE